MAKVIIFSREFPKYHPKAGQPTTFVEKFWACRGIRMLNTDLLPQEYQDVSKLGNLCFPKSHTIRKGNRFKKGDYFSPRVWSGKPYRSKQIIIAPDTKILGVWNIEILRTGAIFINGSIINTEYKNRIERIASNDGLSTSDFIDWFDSNQPFKGQIICWNETVKY